MRIASSTYTHTTARQNLAVMYHMCDACIHNKTKYITYHATHNELNDGSMQYAQRYQPKLHRKTFNTASINTDITAAKQQQ